MMSRKDANKWLDIVLANLDNIARAKSTDHIEVQIDHCIDIANGRGSICFRVQWKGGPHGCVQTDKDMDSHAEGVARAIPVQCWFGEPDEVKRSKALPHTFDAYVYITK